MKSGILSKCLNSQIISVSPRRAHRRALQAIRLSSTMNAVSHEAPPNPSKPPLSAMPTGVLLRSLCIAAVSSRPYLLGPTLSVLSYISKPGQGLLLDIERNHVLRMILKQTFYKQFCAGETGAEVRATMAKMRGMGFRGTILTYAKETVFDQKTNTQQGMGVSSQVTDKNGQCEHIEAWRKGTLGSVDLLGKGDQLAVKLTGAGPMVTEAFVSGGQVPQKMTEAMDEICVKCKQRGVHILIDAESQQFQRGIFRLGIDLMRKHNRDGHALLYNTYQAYLKSTPSTLAEHLQTASKDSFTLGLKLVRGAYIASDKRALIHDTKKETDNAYDSIAQGALKRQLGDFGDHESHPFPSVHLFLASHNKHSIMAAHQLHQQRVHSGFPTVPVRFAQLHGMSDEVSFGLLQLKNGNKDAAPEVFKCSTWGSMGDCLGYLLRRAIENRDAVSRTVDEYNALKSEVRRRFRSVLFGRF